MFIQLRYVSIEIASINPQLLLRLSSLFNFFSYFNFLSVYLYPITAILSSLFDFHRFPRDLSQFLALLRAHLTHVGAERAAREGPLRVLGRVINRRALSIRGEVTLERQRTSEQVCPCVRRVLPTGESTTGPSTRARSRIHEAPARRRSRLAGRSSGAHFRTLARGTGAVSFSAGNIKPLAVYS